MKTIARKSALVILLSLLILGSASVVDIVWNDGGLVKETWGAVVNIKSKYVNGALRFYSNSTANLLTLDTTSVTVGTDLTFVNGEAIANSPDGTFDFGAANLTTTGTVTSGQQVQGDTALSGDVTLDDGSGASPFLKFQDETNETATFQKTDAGYLGLTTVAGDGLQLVTGNVKIGDGTPDSTINGEDLYCEGISEFDGTVRIDGTLDVNGAVDVDSSDVDVTSTGNSATAIELTASTNGGGITLATSTGGVDVNLTATGPFAIDGDLTCIGNTGSDGGTANGDNDLLVAGDAEVDGIVDIDGSIDADVSDCDINSTGTSATAVEVTTSATGGITLAPGAAGIDVNLTSAGPLAVDGDAVIIGNTGSDGDLANGDNDLLVAGDLEVDTNFRNDGATDLNGAVDIDTSDCDINSTATAATAIELTATAGAGGGVTIACGTGGLDINLTSTGPMAIDGDLVCIGNTGSDGGTADGDNDLLVVGDAEVDGNIIADGNLTGDGATVFDGFVYDAIDATTDTVVTIAQSGNVFTNSGASSTEITFTLPTAAEGLYYIFSVVDSATVNVDCGGSDRIITTNVDGDKLQNTGTAGDAITIICRSASGTTNWVLASKIGTWSDAD